MENSKHEKNDKSRDEQQLGMDQLFEILSWMSAKQVLKFSSLSKSLFRFLSLPSFVERQTVRSSVVDGGFFLQHDFYWYRYPKPTFHVLPGASPSTGIPGESLSFILETSRVLASSQGLLLHNVQSLHNTKSSLFLCNPATRSYVALPLPEWLKLRRWYFIGSTLECHPRNLINTNPQFDDYSVMIPVGGESNSDDQLAVYSKGKWEVHTLNEEGRQLTLHMPFCLFRGGIVIHYMSYRASPNSVKEPYLVAYDVGMKAFSRRFKLPEGSWEGGKYYGSQPIIFKWKRPNINGGETIGLVNIHSKDRKNKEELTLTVWVLEDYESGSWRRVVQKTAAEMGVPEEDVSFLSGSCDVVNGMGLMFAMKSRVYLYTMEGAHSGRLQVVGERDYPGAGTLTFVLYANTLRPVYAGESPVVTF